MVDRYYGQGMVRPGAFSLGGKMWPPPTRKSPPARYRKSGLAELWDTYTAAELDRVMRLRRFPLEMR